MVDLEFEGPLFKRLPNNDTGAAPGHQAGILIPKELDKYFPELPAASAENPAPNVSIRAILAIGSVSVGTVDTVYQHQTWGGTRRPERRITANLGALRNKASRGDLLLMDRSLEDDFLYRFTLLKVGTPEFVAADLLTGGKRWGVLAGHIPPVSKAQIASAEAEILADITSPFQRFEANVKQQITTRIARGRAFRRLVVRTYDNRCAICGGGLTTPSGQSEIEAAHIIRRGEFGSDDVRNGLALCRAHHWAFDRGLLGIDSDFTVLVHVPSLLVPQNTSLQDIVGRPLLSPQNASHAPHSEAIAWHRTHVFGNSLLSG